MWVTPEGGKVGDNDSISGRHKKRPYKESKILWPLHIIVSENRENDSASYVDPTKFSPCK